MVYGTDVNKCADWLLQNLPLLIGHQRNGGLLYFGPPRCDLGEIQHIVQTSFPVAVESVERVGSVQPKSMELDDIDFDDEIEDLTSVSTKLFKLI